MIIVGLVLSTFAWVFTGFLMNGFWLVGIILASALIWRALK